MSVREVATQDIKQELELQGKCFIMFQEKLDPYMDMLVNERIKEQNKVSSKSVKA
jgi:hypothetical protein